MAIAGLVWAIGTVLGPVIGGAFADSAATWRWAFYINLVVGAIFTPAYLFLLPDIDFQRNVSFRKKLQQVDWLGIVFFDGAMACLIMAISFGGSVFAWNSASEIVLWVMMVVLFIVFGLTQHFTPFVDKRHKLYPTQYLRQPLLLNLQAQLFLSSGVLLGAAYYIPLYFQFARGDNALTAGVRLLPYISLMATFALINGSMMSKLGYYMPWYVFGAAMILIGSALMYTVDVNTSNAKVYGFTLLMGVGVGCYVQACYPVSQNLVPASEVSDVVGFMGIAQSTGITFFLSLMGTVFNNQAAKKVREILPNTPESEIVQVTAGTSAKVFRLLNEEQRADVIFAVIDSMKASWAILMTAGAISLILSLFLGVSLLYFFSFMEIPYLTDANQTIAG